MTFQGVWAKKKETSCTDGLYVPLQIYLLYFTC